jgi:hypothetical protein
MFTGVLLAAESAPGGQLWRPLLIFGAVAVLMGLVVLAQMTDPRRRSRAEADLDADPVPSTPQASDPGSPADRPATGPEER